MIMDIKTSLCEEFCGQLTVRQVPAGYAVGTEFSGIGGDPIGFYIVGPDAVGKYRIEDDGATVTILEACGAHLEIESRAKAFSELLAEYGASFNDDQGEIYTPAVGQGDIPKAAIKFVALLLRLQDLLMTTHEKAANTFKEEALRELRKTLGSRAEVSEDEAVNEKLSEWQADAVIRAPNRDPVAVFLVLTDTRLYEAIMMQMMATYQVREPCKVVALLEKQTSVSAKASAHATNRVSIRRFRGDEQAAMNAIAYDALGVASAAIN